MEKAFEIILLLKLLWIIKEIKTIIVNRNVRIAFKLRKFYAKIP